MELQIGGLSAVYLAKEYGTPLYVYDKQIILRRVQELKEAFPQAKICYAIKANSNLHILQLVVQQGLGADCSSKAEIEIAELAGFDMKKSIYSAVNPSNDDLKKALESGIILNLDDLSIFRRLQKIGLPRKISFRVNPGFGEGKFPGIVCAGEDSKFGMTEERAAEAYRLAKENGIVHFGIHMMTGSCVMNEAYFEEMTKAIQDIAVRIGNKVGIEFEFIDIGGGFGVPYEAHERALDMKSVSERIKRVFTYPANLVMEPGRYFVAEAGTLLTTVTTMKGKFVGVDAGMTTLIRPALYGAYHPIVLANNPSALFTEKYSIVGPICESTDCFARDRDMPVVHEGDILAIQVAGAYGFAMASQFNGQPKPAEVMVSHGIHTIIRKRETTEDLIRYARH
ncbi:diaminopimelate decarboxylase [Candidatus Woesearchaeota archaeon]|nr:diaminopimelate decarboxylase [Candidatus Woesearchaeota archaeon]